MPQEADVCSGGNVSKNDSSFTFVNHHTQSCDVDFTTAPPGAGSSYTVPAKSGSTPGTTVVYYTSGIAGDYPYNKPACCGAGMTNPAIKIQ
jgi:hypothetical protein